MSDMDDGSDDTGSDFAAGRDQSNYQNPPPPEVGPYLEIAEQPQSRGFRFRYACEGKSHGGLQGISSRREKKSHPSVKINRYKGPARIEVSLVTDESTPRPHAHELIGKNCHNGKCGVDIKGDSMCVSFPNLGVRHVTKKSVQEILTKRYEEMFKLDKQRRCQTRPLPHLDRFMLTPEEKCRVNQLASEQAKSIQLSVVRLSFTAYVPDGTGQLIQPLPSVISNPIFDSKAPCTSLLKICRMDKVGGCCTGNEEVFLLCDKVQKDDISVRFFEQDEDGELKWEAFGNFSPHDVHRQYAIVFRTPPYSNHNIITPVMVHVQLRRGSDNEVSDPKTFTYFPQQTDMEDIQKKRKKQIPNFGDEQVFPTANGYFVDSQMAFPPSGNVSFGNMQQYDTSGNNGHNRQVNPSNFSIWSSVNPATFDANMMMSQQLKSPPLIPLPVACLQADSADISSHYRSQSINQSQLIKQSQSISQSQSRQSYPTSSSKHSFLPRGVSDSNLISRGSAVARKDVEGLEPALMTGKSSAQISAVKSEQEMYHPKTDDTKVKSNPFKSQVNKSAQSEKRVKPGSRSGEVKAEVSEAVPCSEDIKFELPNARHDKPFEVSVKVEPVSDDKSSTSHVDNENISINRKLVRLQALASVFTCTLHGYAMTGDVKHLLYPSRRLIANQNDDGDNPIHLAVIHAQAMALLNFLAVLATLPVPKAVDDRNFLKQTPLYLSVITEQVDLVDILLKYGADCFTLDKHGNTLLHIAAKSGYNTCLEKLLTKWLNNVKSGVWHPCINSLNYEGFSALHLSVRHEQLGCVKLLIELGGADVNLRDGSSGRTALHHAVDVNNLVIIGYLIVNARADIDAPRYDGNTPLHLAVSENKPHIVSVLVAAGANTEALNFEHDETDESEDDNDQMDKNQVDNDLETDGGEDHDYEDDSSSQDVHGLTPKDLAKCNTQMLQILNPKKDRTTIDCERFAANVRLDDKHDKQLKSVCDSGIESILIHSVPATLSGAANLVGSSHLYSASLLSAEESCSSDLHNLDPMLRAKLAKLLDPVKSGSDWKELAQRLRLGSLVEALQNSTSPTRAVLDNFEECGGTITALRTALINMERNDAVELLKISI